MIFSYRVANRYILKDIELPLGPANVILLTGEENRSFELLGGIVAGLFPVEGANMVGHLEQLVRDLSGELDITDGRIPESSVYIGPDPERHLLFSRVDEEIYAQTGLLQDQNTVLDRFGLGSCFVERRISTLSGGEKMRLALSIAFSKSTQCTVLHGVVPWLDVKGKIKLQEEIEKIRQRGGCVLILEQEIEGLLPVADEIFYFKGGKLVTCKRENISRRRDPVRSLLSRVTQTVKKNQNSSELIRFSNIRFQYEKLLQDGFQLADISFSLRSSTVYGLTGDNGAGKSTIARIIMRLESPLSGTVFFRGKDLQTIPRADLVSNVCYVGQFPEQQITLSTVDQYRKKAHRTENEISKALLHGYFDDERRYPIAQLSPLDMKILCIAAFTCADTALVILDEPTWGIDAEGELRLCEVLLGIASHIPGISILIISHDHGFIHALDAEVLRLEGGHIVTH